MSESNPQAVQAIQGIVLLAILGALAYCAFTPSDQTASETPPPPVAQAAPVPQAAPGPTRSLEELQAEGQAAARAYLETPLPKQSRSKSPPLPSAEPPPSSPDRSKPAPEPAERRARPGTTIHFNDGTWMCKNRAALELLMVYGGQGMKDEYDAMLHRHGGPCLEVLPGMMFKVVKVDGSLLGLEMPILQVKSLNGWGPLWAIGRGVREIKP